MTESSTIDTMLRRLAESPARAPREPDPDRLAHFLVQGRMGAGGMGVVFRAIDEKLQRSVALKVLPSGFESNPDRRRRFLREARAAAALTHPHIAAVYEIGEADGRVYIAMELVEGETLRSRMRRGRLPLSDVTRIALELLDALSRAHGRGVVHCDLKPENIMLDDRGAVKVLDFGLARLSAPEPAGAPRGELALAETSLSPTEEGRVVGTPGYMAPEQARGESPDARTDVFAVGVVLYEMLAGGRPFQGKSAFEVLVAVERDPPASLRERGVDVPRKLEALVLRCLEKQRGARYATAEEVKDDLATLSIPPTRAAPRTLASRWPWLVGVAVGATVAVGLRRLAPADRAAQPAPPLSASAARVSLRVGLLDHPAPATSSQQAASEYRRALTDLRDAVRAPQMALGRAVALDPEFAAAHLRIAMFKGGPPATTAAYREALRFQDKLDERDRAILHAEEPMGAGVPPDLEEADRRYSALLAKYPGDVEIMLRLISLRIKREPPGAVSTAALLLALDPTDAVVERLAGDAASANDEPASAKEHYDRCIALSPNAIRCLSRVARAHALAGKCDDYSSVVKRMLGLEPDDWFVRREALSAALTTGQGEDVVQSAAAGLVALEDPTVAAFHKDDMAGTILLFRGMMLEARAAFLRAETSARRDGAAKVTPVTTNERLIIAEELGDEAELGSVTREYVGGRALATPEAESDGVVLSALARHRVLPAAEIVRLRDRWKADAPARSKAVEWLEYEVPLAITPAQAEQTLATGNASLVREDRPDASARLGRLLLLAGRYDEAAARLATGAETCALFRDDLSFVTVVVPASFELGQAREGLGDREGACQAYRHVLDLWGTAKPRSRTADAARARVAALSCRF